jgi:hypothetical protein
MDEKLAIRRHLADLDARAADLGVLDQALAQRALKDQDAARLIGVDPVWWSLRGLVNYATGWTFCMSASYVMGER